MGHQQTMASPVSHNQRVVLSSSTGSMIDTWMKWTHGYQVWWIWWWGPEALSSLLAVWRFLAGILQHVWQSWHTETQTCSQQNSWDFCSFIIPPTMVPSIISWFTIFTIIKNCDFPVGKLLIYQRVCHRFWQKPVILKDPAGWSWVSGSGSKRYFPSPPLTW